MLSPFMTVVVLVVLWLIVVVPMVFRRSDERRRDRAVDDFGRAMRALGRRSQTPTTAAADQRDRSEVFVPHRHPAGAAVPARRPVPAAQEALMYPPDHSELSQARLQMLRRRRRSLGVLILGSLVCTVLAVLVGDSVGWLALLFVAGLVGYLWFLRGQALRDRTRRENRQARAASRQPAGYDATGAAESFEELPQTAVRIDDDDLELHSMDTIDLTGLYQDEPMPVAEQRRAS